MEDENPTTFDQIIARVRNMLAYGMEVEEMIEMFTSEGHSREEVYLTVQAAKLL